MATRIDVGTDTPMFGLARMAPLIISAGIAALCSAGISFPFAAVTLADERGKEPTAPVAIGAGLLAIVMVWLTVWMTWRQVRRGRQHTRSRYGLLLDDFGIWWREDTRCFPIGWTELAGVAIGSKRLWNVGNRAMDIHFVLTPARPEEFWPRHPELHSFYDNGACWIYAPASGFLHPEFREAVVRFAPRLWRAGAHRNPVLRATAEVDDFLLIRPYLRR